MCMHHCTYDAVIKEWNDWYIKITWKHQSILVLSKSDKMHVKEKNIYLFRFGIFHHWDGNILRDRNDANIFAKIVTWKLINKNHANTSLMKLIAMFNMNVNVYYKIYFLIIL